MSTNRVFRALWILALAHIAISFNSNPSIVGMKSEHSHLRPASLAFQIAFDHCALNLAEVSGSLSVAVSNPFYAREILRRWSGTAILWPQENCPSDPDQLRGAIGTEVCWEQVQLSNSAQALTAEPIRGFAWSIPTEHSWQETLTVITRHASMGARLVVVGQTAHARRFLPDAPSASGQPAELAAIAAGLKSHNWHVQSVYGFQGPLSILLGMASRLPSLAGRQDLVDRCFAAVRKHFTVAGRQAAWSLVWVITADLEQAP